MTSSTQKDNSKAVPPLQTRLADEGIKVLDELYARHPDTQGVQTAIETGTLHGETTRALAEYFEAVHTIELGEELYRAALVMFAEKQGYGCIYCHLGDSAEVLPKLLERKDFQKPILFYLDAHWFHHKDVPSKRPAPLFAEIEAIGKHPFADVVIVDDCQHLGVGWVETDSEWGKSMDISWKSNSPDLINKTLGRVRDVFTVTWKTQHMIFVQEAAS